MKVILLSLVILSPLIACGENMPLSAIPSSRLANPSLSY